MTFEEYIREMRHKLDEFERNWKFKNSLHPKHYPMDMGGGDWDEQFDIFVPQETEDGGP
jgi:hypothetical protein